MAVCNSNDPEADKKMRQLLGPHALDHAIRQAISMCWMLLPEGRRSVEAVEAEMQRVLDRALKDLKEDATAFGMPSFPPPT